MLPLCVTHRGILSHHQKAGTAERTTHVRDMGEFCFLSKKNQTQTFLLSSGESLEGGYLEGSVSVTFLFVSVR